MSAIDIKNMTVEEKFEAMELLWDDMCRNVPEIVSPEWHEEILLEREQNLKNGNDQFEDWNDVKKELRKMANDPDIQREIRMIETEFSTTEFDGLKTG